MGEIRDTGDVKITRKKLSDYRQNDRNPVKHNPRNFGVVVDSVNRFGPARSGVAADGKIYAGNLTWEAMAEAGIEDVIEVTTDGKAWVIVNRPDLTDEQLKRYAVQDERSSELADWDAEILAAIRLDDDGALDGLFDDDELAEILGDLLKDDVPEDAGAFVEEVEYITCPECGHCWPR